MTVATIVFALAVLLMVWYLRRRVGTRISLTFLLFAILVVVHGAPMLIYLHLTGPDTFIFEAALARVDRVAVQTTVLLAIAVMFIGLVLGSELATHLFARTHARGQAALKQQAGKPDFLRFQLSSLSVAILWLLVVAMASVSIAESQLSKVTTYFAAGGGEIEKLLVRLEEGGSRFYVYNLVLYSVAPFLVMVAHRSAPRLKLMNAPSGLAIALFAVVLLGKLAMLSKAPPVIFLLQLLLLRMIVRGSQFSWVPFLKLLGFTIALFAVMVRLTIPELDLASVFGFLYYRIFDIPNESLIEYFSAIPATLPHTWGAGVLPFLRDAAESGWVPMHTAVAEVTRNSLESTSNVLFIGDAWAEFSWIGVALFSIAAGALVKGIDIFAFRRGVNDESACLVAGCAFGVFTMLSTALNTALLTGGLALLPLISALLFRSARQRRLKPQPPDPGSLPSSGTGTQATSRAHCVRRTLGPATLTTEPQRTHP